MWPETAASNQSAWDVSDAWMRRKRLSPNVRDYHSLHWLMYAYLQQGRYRKADELLALMKKSMTESTYDNKLRPGYYENNHANMAAAFIVETERWELAATLFANPPSTTNSSGAVTTGSHGAHGTQAATGESMTVRSSSASQQLPVFIRALSSLYLKSPLPNSELTPTGRDAMSKNAGFTIKELQIAGLSASLKGNHYQAIELMNRAVKIEEGMAPPSGPPSLIKPTHELFGEILLRAGKPKEAAEQFKIALLRQPNRARSLLGAARAAKASGDQKTAASFYAKLVEQWQLADNDLAELREGRDFLKQVAAN
jgi:tetratricopeptide (TPR) repeat protein